MKRTLSILLIFVILFMCCSCSTIDQKELNPNQSSQQQTEEQKEERLLKDAETVADTFIKAFFNAKYNESNALSCLDFKQQVTEINKIYPNANSGIYYDGDRVIWDGENFESTQKCLEAVEEKFSSMSLQKYEIKDINLFNSEEFDSVVELRETFEVNLFSDCEFSFGKFAIVDYSVVMQVEDATPQGMQTETHDGTVSVLLLYLEGQWKVYSPTIMGLFCGYVYFK